MIDSKDIKRSWGNPFVRREIECTSCGTKIKTKMWVFILWWLWVALGAYNLSAEHDSQIVSIVLLITMGVMFGLIYLGLSHESEKNT